MAPAELRDTLKQQLFEAFRIVLTDGEGYDIRPPDLLLVGKRSAMVGLAGDGREPYYERTVKVDLLHLSRIEPLSKTARRKTNGKGRQFTSPGGALVAGLRATRGLLLQPVQ
jgi:hypothetical protein